MVRPAPHLPITQARTSSVCLPGAGLTKTRTTHMAVPKDALPPMSTIAWSHHMAGDARPSLELPRVFLNEVNARMIEIPFQNTRGVRTSMKKFP